MELTARDHIQPEPTLSGGSAQSGPSTANDSTEPHNDLIATNSDSNQTTTTALAPPMDQQPPVRWLIIIKHPDACITSTTNKTEQILLWNVRSLNKQINPFQSYIYSNDFTIIALTETWLSSHVYIYQRNLPFWIFCYKERS